MTAVTVTRREDAPLPDFEYDERPVRLEERFISPKREPTLKSEKMTPFVWDTTVAKLEPNIGFSPMPAVLYFYGGRGTVKWRVRRTDVPQTGISSLYDIERAFRKTVWTYERLLARAGQWSDMSSISLAGGEGGQDAYPVANSSAMDLSLMSTLFYSTSRRPVATIATKPLPNHQGLSYDSVDKLIGRKGIAGWWRDAAIKMMPARGRSNAPSVLNNYERNLLLMGVGETLLSRTGGRPFLMAPFFSPNIKPGVFLYRRAKETLDVIDGRRDVAEYLAQPTSFYLPTDPKSRRDASAGLAFDAIKGGGNTADDGFMRIAGREDYAMSVWTETGTGAPFFTHSPVDLATGAKTTPRPFTGLVPSEVRNTMYAARFLYDGSAREGGKYLGFVLEADKTALFEAFLTPAYRKMFSRTEQDYAACKCIFILRNFSKNRYRLEIWVD